MIFRVVLSISFLIDWTSSLYLPGSCSYLYPPSNEITKSTDYRVIGKASLNGNRKTFLFGGVLDEPCDVHLNTTHLILDKDSPDKSVRGNISKLLNNGYLSVMSSASAVEDSDLYEEVFRFMETRYGAFLWSCLDYPREQGVLVLMDTNEELRLELAEVLSDMKTIVPMYIRNSVVDGIKWEELEGGSTFCSLKMKSILPYFTSLGSGSTVLIVIVLLVMACSLVKCYLSKRMRSGQVYPLHYLE